MTGSGNNFLLRRQIILRGFGVFFLLKKSNKYFTGLEEEA